MCDGVMMFTAVSRACKYCTCSVAVSWHACSYCSTCCGLLPKVPRLESLLRTISHQHAAQRFFFFYIPKVLELSLFSQFYRTFTETLTLLVVLFRLRLCHRDKACFLWGRKTVKFECLLEKSLSPYCETWLRNLTVPQAHHTHSQHSLA
jgi:hypothetical protein